MYVPHGTTQSKNAPVVRVMAFAVPPTSPLGMVYRFAKDAAPSIMYGTAMSLQFAPVI